jgi:adenine-specific DNA-methyltransferase
MRRATSNNEKMPPSRVRYASYYHVWTTIILNDRPELFGKALRRKDTSDTDVSFVIEFHDLHDLSVLLQDFVQFFRRCPPPGTIRENDPAGTCISYEARNRLNGDKSLTDWVASELLKNRRGNMANMKWTNEWIRDAEGPNREFLFLLEKNRIAGDFGAGDECDITDGPERSVARVSGMAGSVPSA